MAPGRALIIVNPASNHGEAGSLVPMVADLAANLFQNELVIADAPAHAQQLAADATDYDTVIAMGGDGAVHEVLNGLMTRPAEQRPALTVLPVGSGNDYARTLGIAFDVSSALLQIASGTRKQVDVGTCNDRYFANTLAVGVDAQVTARAVELKATTKRTGLLLYLSALMHVLSKEYQTYEVRISFDDDEPELWSMTLAAFTHGQTYGGGFHITPEAISDDGLMDVCRLDAIPLWQVYWRVPFVIPGKHAWMKPVTMSRHARVLIESDRPLPGQIDGEVLLERRYDIGLEHRELTVLVPDVSS